MIANKIYSALVLTIGVVAFSCEAFVIGQNASGQAPVERSQKTSVGVAYLFKAELDSNNSNAATDLMLHVSGRKLLAVEKYDLADDLERWKNVMNQKAVTEYKIDTVSADVHVVTLTIEFIRNVNIGTKYDGSAWYITSVKDAPSRKR